MFAFQIAGHTRLIAAVAVADVVNVQIEMIAPEEWSKCECFPCTEHIARGGLTLALSDNPVFHADPARARIGPPGNVASRKNSRNVRFQKFIYQHTVIGRDARFLGETCIWANADPDDN